LLGIKNPNLGSCPRLGFLGHHCVLREEEDRITGSEPGRRLIVPIGIATRVPPAPIGPDPARVIPIIEACKADSDKEREPVMMVVVMPVAIPGRMPRPDYACVTHASDWRSHGMNATHAAH